MALQTCKHQFYDTALYSIKASSNLSFSCCYFRWKELPRTLTIRKHTHETATEFVHWNFKHFQSELKNNMVSGKLTLDYM